MALTLQQQQQLQTLLQQPAYATLSDADAATLASTPTYVPVPYTTFQPAVMQLACWGSVRTAAANLSTYPAALQPVILTAVDLFATYKAPNVDLSLKAFQQALGALEQAGLVSAADGQAILALGQLLPVGVAVQAADVTAARAVNAQQNTVRQLVDLSQRKQSAMLALINTFANGPVTGTPPTASQLDAAGAQVGS